MSRLVFLFAVALIAAAHADAAQRTFVSTSGNDASATCSLVAPCRSFGKAMTVTDPNGEIIVLDSGGYGRVTIDRSVAIIAPPGIYAGISVFSGLNGIDIATPGVNVVLRGIFINGQGGTAGISFVAGAELHVDGCSISGMATLGISAIAGSLYVHDTLVRDNGNAGIFISGANAQLDRVRVEANGGDGVSVSSTSRVLIRDSLIADNAFGGVSGTAGSLTRIDIESTAITGNGRAGVTVESAIVADKGEVSIARSTISRNGPAVGGEGLGANGNVHMSVTDSTVTGNFGYGLIVANGGTMLVSSNLVTKNALAGLFNSTSTFNSMSNNVVQDNFGGPSGGTITPIGGL